MARPILPELEQLERLLEHPDLRHRILTTVDDLPLYEIEIGSQADNVPTLALYGGIHGNERIGSQVLLAWLEHLVTRLAWDSTLHHLLSKVRIIMTPLVNITGLHRGTRSTSQGIDLMRNAPVNARGLHIWPLAGQQLTRHMPWYRGTELAPENRALIQSVTELRARASFVLVTDFHSGFGMKDRLWFPYAAHRLPPPHLAEAVALCDMFNQNYPMHDFYVIEPQSVQYTTHGDLWDYMYDMSRQDDGAILLPFTLEMGSWLWLRKNPRQLFDRIGMFHPVLPHRLRRVLRRHWTLLDFLLRATAEYEYWQPDPLERFTLHQVGVERWYLS
jgi:hypothetical protein